MLDLLLLLLELTFKNVLAYLDSPYVVLAFGLVSIFVVPTVMCSGIESEEIEVDPQPFDLELFSPLTNLSLPYAFCLVISRVSVSISSRASASISASFAARAASSYVSETSKTLSGSLL